MKHRVVVTGYGLASPIGMSVADFERNLFAGKSGVRDIRGQLVPKDFPVPYAAWIRRDELPPSRLYARPERALKSWLMTEHAAREALRGLDPEHGLDAVVYGTADGVSYEIANEVMRDGPQGFETAAFCSESSLYAIRDLAETLGFGVLDDRKLICINSACASGNQAIGIAFEGIRDGRWSRCLAGGVDARCEPSNFLNFFHLGALTTADLPPEKASRPFSKDRSGFVRGEGAAALVLESEASARARGATILGYVEGYGCTSDAFRLTDGRDDGSSVVEAIRRAVTSAGLGAEAIDYINAHGTSTPLNDRLETLAIKQVFGERARSIPVSSLKSQIGHSTIASSALEAIACLLMLQRQRVSPTLNCDVPDPECDLDYVPNVSRDHALKHVLSNSFGFGGQNTCLVLGKADPS